MLKFLPSVLLLASLVPGQGATPSLMTNLRTLGGPMSVVDTASETVSPVVYSLPVSTGLATSLGVEGWYSDHPTISGEYVDNILIVGFDASGTGGIRHLSRPGDSSTVPYTLVSSTHLAGGIEPSGIVYDSYASSLFYVDRVSKLVYRGTWDGTAALSSVSLQPWFDASAQVLSGSPSLDLLGGFEPSVELVRPAPADRLRVTPRRRAISGVIGISPWVIVDIATAQDIGFTLPVIDGDEFLLDRASVRDGATGVRVLVGKGFAHSFVLERADTGLVLGVAQQVVGDSEVVISSSVPLEVGQVYKVLRDGLLSDIRKCRCMVRVGDPGDLTGNGQVAMGRLLFDTKLRDGTDLMMSCPATSVSGSDITVITSITWNSAVPGSGVYPVIPVGGGIYVISSASSLPLLVRDLSGSFASWIFYDPLPIPNVPGAAGTVLLMQSVVVDGVGGVYVSDILGGEVLPPL